MLTWLIENKLSLESLHALKHCIVSKEDTNIHLEAERPVLLYIFNEAFTPTALSTCHSPRHLRHNFSNQIHSFSFTREAMCHFEHLSVQAFRRAIPLYVSNISISLLRLHSKSFPHHGHSASFATRSSKPLPSSHPPTQRLHFHLHTPHDSTLTWIIKAHSRH